MGHTSPFRVTRAEWAAVGVALCATNPAPVAQAGPPAAARVTTCARVEARPLVWVADGAGDLRGCSTSLARTSASDRDPVEVVAFPWSHGYRRVMLDQIDYKHAREQGLRLAEAVRERSVREPGRRVVLVAHSAGAAVALAAAETLPAASIDRMILLAPSVSSDYDPRRAAAACREGIDVFCSPRDVWALGVAMRLVGTTDRRLSTAAAGRYGFRPRGAASDELGEVVRHHFWTRDLEWTGHTGGHYGSYAPTFARLYLLPLMTGSK